VRWVPFLILFYTVLVQDRFLLMTERFMVRLPVPLAP